MKSFFAALTLGMSLGFAAVAHATEGGIEWRAGPLEDALFESRAHGKPALVFVTADWCSACKAMEEEFSKPEFVRAIMAEFIPVKLEQGHADADIERLKIYGFPTFIVYSGLYSDKVGYRLGGAYADEFLAWARDAVHNGKSIEQLELEIDQHPESFDAKKMFIHRAALELEVLKARAMYDRALRENGAQMATEWEGLLWSVAQGYFHSRDAFDRREVVRLAQELIDRGGPGWPQQAYGMLTRYYITTDQFETAIETAIKGIDAFPDASELYIDILIAGFNAQTPNDLVLGYGERGLAKVDVDESFDAGGRAFYRYYLARLYDMGQNLDRALALMEEVATLVPDTEDNADYYAYLADLRTRHGG